MASSKLKPDEIVALQDIILEFILSNGWKDYHDFCRLLSERILKKNSTQKREIVDAIISVSHPFFSFNEVSKQDFLKRFPTDAVINRLRNMPKTQEEVKVKVSVFSARPPSKLKSIVSIDEIFPEINSIDIPTGKSLAETAVNIYERVIQDALRDSLREKKATNIGERKSDSALEVADIEDFTLRIKGESKSFSAVAKGAKSVGKANVIFQDIAHQILKANETHPDHILLIVAKPLVDGVVSKIVEYGTDCGNRNLVIIMDSVNLARFLRFRKII